MTRGRRKYLTLNNLKMNLMVEMVHTQRRLYPEMLNMIENRNRGNPLIEINLADKERSEYLKHKNFLYNISSESEEEWSEPERNVSKSRIGIETCTDLNTPNSAARVPLKSRMKRLSSSGYSSLLLWFLILVSPGFVKKTIGGFIELSDNGPVTFDTPITFTVKNSYRTIEPSYEYRFKFDQFPQHDKTIVSTSGEVVYSVIFESSAAPYEYYYRVHLDVWYCHLGKPVSSIGAAYQTFILLDSLIGVIDVSQDIDEESLVNNFVSTTSPVNLTAKIHDPSGFFASVNITYKWTVNGSPQEESYDQFIIQNFTQPQINKVSVIVSATSLQKSGLFEISLQSKDPIHNLTADGHTNVELFRGESLQLNIKINGGTPPFFYCWEITNSTTLAKICKPTNESIFSIIRYFMEIGEKNLTISVKNDVSTFTKNMTILIYEIELGTFLSFILLPVCSIIIDIFIIAGIAFYMKQRQELTIEVADFDFQSIDERMERTFWERIRDSFTQSAPVQFFELCGFTRFNDADQEVDDILPDEPNISECNLRFSGDRDDSDESGDFRS